VCIGARNAYISTDNALDLKFSQQWLQSQS
jgi:hypothetical protein